MKRITILNDKQSIVDIALGKNVKIYNFVNAYGCKIGDGTKIGSFVEIQKGVVIGKKCKISSHTFICEGVVIKDEVFIGHNVTFINDKFPRATNKKGQLKNDRDWKVLKTIIEKGASIGSSVTIMCGVTIGKNAFVGAGSLVTKNVPSNTIVFGAPAKIIGKISHTNKL